MQNSNNNPGKRISMGKAFIMYITVSLFLFFEMAIQVSPSVMTSQLMHDLQISVFCLGIMSGFYFYSYTAMQIPAGLLFDYFNPRLIIVTSIITCVLGILFLGMSTNMLLACVARLLMGFGSAFAFVAVLVVTADLFPSKYFATMTGITQMLAAFGAMAGQLPVHILVNYLGWRHTLFLFALFGILLAGATYYFLQYDKNQADYNRAANTKVLTTNLKQLIANKQSWYVGIYACLLWAPMSGFASLWGVPFLKNVDGLSNNQAAFVCSLMWLGLAIASPLLGYLSMQFVSRKIGLALSALIGFIAFTIILFIPISNITIIAFLLLLAGAACSGQALSFAVVKENNSAKTAASAISFNNMAVVISGALFQPLIGGLLHFFAEDKLIKYQIALFVIVLAYGIGFVIAAFLIEEPASKKTCSTIRLSVDKARSILQC